jgi:hypothetical protein
VPGRGGCGRPPAREKQEAAHCREGSDDDGHWENAEWRARSGDESGGGRASSGTAKSDQRSGGRNASYARKQPSRQGSNEGHRGKAEVTPRTRGRHGGGDEWACEEEGA